MYSINIKQTFFLIPAFYVLALQLHLIYDKTLKSKLCRICARDSVAATFMHDKNTKKAE